MLKIKYIVLISIIIGVFIQCDSDPLNVKIDNEAIDLNLSRMEEDLLGQNDKPINQLNKELLSKYSSLYEVFVSKMIVEGSVHDPAVGVRLDQFRHDSVINAIYNDIQIEFGDFEKYKKELEEAFSYYNYYFPDSVLPSIITFYSNFNAKIFPANNSLAIGLDMYLGSENQYVKKIPLDMLPQFIKEDMNEKFLVSDAMKYWLLNRYYDENIGDDFASKIIELGKIMYLLDAMLPNVNDDIKINYTEKELKWVVEHEENIWKTLVDEKILYTKNPMIINQYIVDGPFTKGLPDVSPSKVGIWVGWQIVRDYVRENDVDVLSLLKEKNSLKILRSYKHGNR